MKRTAFKIEKVSNGFIIETLSGTKMVYENPKGVSSYIADSLIASIDFEKPIVRVDLTISEEDSRWYLQETWK